MKLTASVKFNNHKAYVVENISDFKYYRLGSEIIYGTDGIRYVCYKHERPSGNFKAFGGRKFTLKIEDTGEIVECSGQWWDGGYITLAKELNIELVHFTYNTLESLKECYVFYGSYIDKEKFKQVLSEAGELFYYNYREYEKVIKYDDLFSKYVRNQLKLDRIMKSIKKEFLKYKPLKKQKILNYL